MKIINNIMKKDKAITLIALVVTIIILLILAGIAVGFATNGTGLFDKAKLATEEYNNKAQKEENELNRLYNEINNVQSNRENSQVMINNPVGTIISYILGNTAPEGYLKCDGTVYNISDYQALADGINTAFGQYNQWGGDGITTFAVPDLQGEFLRGAGANSHINQGSGASVGVHQNATQHVRMWTGSDYNVTVIGKNNSTSNHDSNINITDNNGAWYNRGGNSTGHTGAVFTSRPTNTSVLYCIKY